jgi:serine protease Do
LKNAEQGAQGTTNITAALDDLVQRVHRFMVVVQNGGQGAGAGIVWRQDGIILTNNHVIQRRQPMVSLTSGEEYRAELIDRDPEIDLALLRIETRNLPPALVSDSRNLRIGELVLAVGHPWGQRGVATMGVISGLGKAETTGPRKTVPIIRSDVLLAPGNSGGPLVNAGGGVVGINTMIVGGDQGVAIPSHLASVFVEEALDRQVVLGVGVQPTPLPAVALEQVAQGQANGLLVVELTPNGPARQAGILPGDILVQLDGLALEQPRALLSALVARTPGERVSLGLLRGGEWREVQANLAPREGWM